MAAYSDVTVHVGADTVLIECRGGSRRQRGAALGAAVRKLPDDFRMTHIGYDEVYGFQSMTYARYDRVTD